MNGKLLKICTAVMLITGVGDVVCQDGGGPMEWTSNQQSKKRKWSDSVSAKVWGRVQASVKISCDGEEQELKLFNEDGTETLEEQRTFRFRVYSNCAGGTVTVRGEEGMVYDSVGEWRVLSSEQSHNTSQSPFVTVKLEMYDGSGNRVALGADNSTIISYNNVSAEKCDWKIVLKPFPLDESSVAGTYIGKLNVIVTANG